MSHPQPSVNYAVIEYGDLSPGITAVIHFYREYDKAVRKFEELCDTVREYTECPDAWDSLLQEDVDAWEQYSYTPGSSFHYHNWDDEYYHFAVERVQANTSIDLHY
jgi:hypothetical protein